MTDILIKNGLVMTPKGFVKEPISIENGVIANIGKSGVADQVIDASGGIVMPGLVNTHTHLGMTLFRGYADDLPLKQWLTEHIWPIEAKLTDADVHIGTLLGCLEMIRSGTTTFADMYIKMDGTAMAVEESGLRGVLSYGMIELGDEEKGERELEIGRKFIKKWNGAADGRIVARYGPHAPNTCSPDFLTRVRERAYKDGVCIHIHLAETKMETDEMMAKYGMCSVRLLDNIGFLGPDVLAAHCVWLSDDDIKILKKSDVKIAHNPTSNMKLASGIAPIPECINNGIVVGIGTDGCASNNTLDMFHEMKMAALLHKVHKLDPTVIPAQEVLKMATINGAHALGIDGGTIAKGKKADIIIVDIHKPHLTPKHSLTSHLVYCAKGSDVGTTIVDGKVLMENYVVKALDEEDIMEKAEKAAENLISSCA
ncbi:MAG: amidohydrolase family protein [Methanosarcinales archaeon Met12]|nr:MAG: amidohydrolase family protein [Methanosarcinales archaeon Met12]